MSFFENTSIPQEIIAEGNNMESVLGSALHSAKSAVTQPTKNIIPDEKPAEKKKKETAPKAEKQDKEENAAAEDTPVEELTPEPVPEPAQESTPAADEPQSKTPEPRTPVSDQCITLSEDIDFDGVLNIHAGKTVIKGSVKGEVYCADLVLEKNKYHMSIHSSGKVSIQDGAVVIGDINASELDNHGAVKGNIITHQSTVCYPSSVVVGDIKANRLEMHENASVKGAITLTGVSVNESEIFGE